MPASGAVTTPTRAVASARLKMLCRLVHSASPSWERFIFGPSAPFRCKASVLRFLGTSHPGLEEQAETGFDRLPAAWPAG